MKGLFFLLPIILITYSCSKETTLQKAENEANMNIQQGISCNSVNFYNELRNYFEHYIIENGLVKEEEKIENGYFSYLTSIPQNGGGINKIENNQTTQDLKKKLRCAGYNLSREQTHLIMFNNISPVVRKYKEDFISENKQSELIYRIGTSDPTESISLTVLNSGILKQYKPSDFKRTFLKNYVIMIFFIQLEL